MSKEKILILIALIFLLCIKSPAQEKIFVNYSFNDHSSSKSISSNVKINSIIGKTVVGMSKSGSSIIKSSSIFNLTATGQNKSDALQNTSMPNNYSLEQNYPNPFNPSTQIKFSVPKESFVNLSIYNLLGEKVKELVLERKAAGTYVVEWNAKDLSSGIYIYNLRSDNFNYSRKLILLK